MRGQGEFLSDPLCPSWLDQPEAAVVWLHRTTENLSATDRRAALADTEWQGRNDVYFRYLKAASG